MLRQLRKEVGMSLTIKSQPLELSIPMTLISIEESDQLH